MKKNIPNILTCFRIVLSIILLLFFHQINIIFLTIFSVAAITDLLDGTLARKYNVCSLLGSILDTLGDVLLYSNIFKLIIISNLLSPSTYIYLIIIFIISFISPLIAYFKFKKFYFIHSLSSKIAGLTIFIIPYSIFFNFSSIYIPIVILLFSLSSFENIIMQILLNEPDSDAKSIYHIIKGI